MRVATRTWSRGRCRSELYTQSDTSTVSNGPPAASIACGNGEAITPAEDKGSAAASLAGVVDVVPLNLPSADGDSC